MLCWKINAPKYTDVNIQLAVGLEHQYNDALMKRLETSR